VQRQYGATDGIPYPEHLGDSTFQTHCTGRAHAAPQLKEQSIRQDRSEEWIDIIPPAELSLSHFGACRLPVKELDAGYLCAGRRVTERAHATCSVCLDASPSAGSRRGTFCAQPREAIAWTASPAWMASPLRVSELLIADVEGAIVLVAENAIFA
jgi:hypothetical protein